MAPWITKEERMKRSGHQHLEPKRPQQKAGPYLCLLLTLSLCLALFQPGTAYAQNTAETATQEASEDTLSKIKTGIQKVTQWLTQADSQKSALNKELKQVELSINALSKQIRQTEQQISRNETELRDLRKEQKSHRAALDKQRRQLEKQIQITYLQEENAQLKLLLNTDNPQDLGRIMYYFSAIKDARTQKIASLQTLLTKVRATEQSIANKTQELQEKKQGLEGQQQKLATQLQKKQSLLSQLQQSIQSNQQELGKLQADQKRIETLIKELEAAALKQKFPNDSGPFSKQKSKLPWPSHAKVRSEFGDKIANGKLTQHGVRFNTRDNDPVMAIYSGRVIFSNWIRGFGLLIIIDHGEQYMSLYGNNKSLMKETGDWVRAGETIAVSSQSSTNPESGLYFEIRKNGKPLNPHQWLRK